VAGGLYGGIYSGMIIGSCEPFSPSGWLACDGTFKSQATYANLFAAIGHTYNNNVDPGDGTFKLPDLNSGRAPRGASVYHPAGETGGSNTHSHSFTTSSNAVINSDGSHYHNGVGPFTVNNSSGDHGHNFNTNVSSNASGSNFASAKLTNGTAGTSRSSHTHNTAVVGSTNNATPHSHSTSAVSGFQLSGGHAHASVNVSNPTINVSSDNFPHELTFYIIKT
jgi:microcystin-dependent protein